MNTCKNGSETSKIIYICILIDNNSLAIAKSSNIPNFKPLQNMTGTSSLEILEDYNCVC